MKIPAGLISSSFILLFMMPAAAQTVAGSELSTFRSWDTLFFSLPFRSYGRDSIPGLGKVHNSNISYTITRSDNNLLIRKEVEYCKDDCVYFLSDTSDWLRIHNDTLLRWIDQEATVMKEEELAPFVYSWKLENGLTQYEEIRESHPDIYGMVFITSGVEVRKIINSSCFERSAHQERSVNLNFNYNTNTKLYQLFKQLDQLTPKWDQQFVFPVRQGPILISTSQDNVLVTLNNEKADQPEADTIYFFLPFNYVYNYNMPGLDTPWMPDVSYVMVKKNNQIETWKHVTYSNDSSKWPLVNSNKLCIDNEKRLLMDP